MLNQVIKQFESVSKEASRAPKETRYWFYETNKIKPFTLHEKIEYGVKLLEMALAKSNYPVVSCSFGMDSMTVLYMAREAMKRLGRNPSDLPVVYNNTLNEFPEVRLFAKKIAVEWDLTVLEYKPKKVLKKIIQDNGGITDDYFMKRKADRSNGRPLSAKCCETLKHEPMRRAVKEHKFDLIINGLREEESNQRRLAAFRDGDYFYSVKEWKSYMIRPIQWLSEVELWDYAQEVNLPFNDLYYKNMIQEYPANDKLQFEMQTNFDALQLSGLDVEALMDEQVQTVTRPQALVLNKMGFKIFTPRTGCQACPIPLKYGGLSWMRRYYPKTYNAMIHNLGYGPVLIKLIPDEVKQDIENFMDIDLDTDNISDILSEILEYRPCTFDKIES